MDNMITLVCGCPSVLATWVIMWWSWPPSVLSKPSDMSLVQFQLETMYLFPLEKVMD